MIKEMIEDFLAVNDDVDADELTAFLNDRVTELLEEVADEFSHSGKHNGDYVIEVVRERLVEGIDE